MILTLSISWCWVPGLISSGKQAISKYNCSIGPIYSSLLYDKFLTFLTILAWHVNRKTPGNIKDIFSVVLGINPNSIFIGIFLSPFTLHFLTVSTNLETKFSLTYPIKIPSRTTG